MRLARIGCWGVLAALVAAGSAARGQDNVVGAIWEITAFEKKGDEFLKVDSGAFRATRDFKIYKGAAQIGKYTQGKEKVSITIDKGKWAGTMDLLLTRKKPPVYRGPWTKPDGTKQPVMLVLKED